MLHIINQSPFNSNCLERCLRIIDQQDVILFIENGVVATLINTSSTPLLNEALKTNSIYALEPDLAARGLLKKVIPAIQVINYAEFVELTIKHYPIQSWV